MIPNHMALVPWHPYRQAVWFAIAQVEARRETDRRQAVYAYANAFFRQLTGRSTISAKDMRMIDITYRPGDRHRTSCLEDYVDALNTLIASRGERCYSPLPGDTRDMLFPEVSRRRQQRFEHKLAMKQTRQQRQAKQVKWHKRRRYQVSLAQAEIELAFVTPGDHEDWLKRWQQQGIEEFDLSNMVFAWTTRFPCLAELDRYHWAAMPFWEARLQVSQISAVLPGTVRSDNRARIPNRLVRR